MWALGKLALALVVSVGCVVGTAASQTSKEITVFAAASLTNALQEIADRFTGKTGTQIKLSFASSSTLAKQIESGAGAQLFLSADEAWMGYLEKAGLIADGTRRSLLGNGLVLAIPAEKTLSVEIGNDAVWLKQVPEGRIATGDPDHVPVGKYAKQALANLGAWHAVEPRLARADNVRNALVLVERGEAVAGIVYSTDAAVSKKVKVAATFPESSHDPISYPVALMKDQDKGDARVFYDFLLTPEAREIFEKYGFKVR